MKKFNICFFMGVLLLIISLSGKNVLASSDIEYDNISSNEIIGLYAITQSVNSTCKVFIDKSIVPFIKSTKREVYYENFEYYYYASKHVDKIISIRAISNDIDSVIFMINELEKKAKEKTTDVSDYKNKCLGYIRSINSSYADTGIYGSKWGIIAGSTDENFVHEVNADYSHGLRINEFFSQFINYDEYNKNLHGELEYKYRRDKDNNPALRLLDPQGKNKKIDLIHMFASIDGIYYKTGNLISFGNKMQHDVVSWNGDLQTAVKELKYDMHDLNFKTSNFYDIMNANIGCSEDDILADIDAMNLTKGYINHDNNSLSNSLSAYYSIIKVFPFRRFTMFMYTATIDVEYFDKSDDAFKNLKEEIYHQFDLKELSDGNIVNFEFKGASFIGYGIMTGDDKTMPSKEIREFVTKNFIKYLKANITQAEC